MSIDARDLSRVRTWAEFVTCLRRFHLESGPSRGDLDRLALTRSTISDVLYGHGRLNRSEVDMLLAVWQVSEPDREAWLAAWERAAVGDQLSPGRRRFDEATPRELGVHQSILAEDDAVDELPDYVWRDFDDRLRDKIAEGVDRGCFVLLLGHSSTGKTRSLYEAVHSVVGTWWLIQPADTREILALAEAPPERTVLWLDEFHRFLGTSPTLTKRVVATLKSARIIVVGTLWPGDFVERKAPRQAGLPDPFAEDRPLLELADVIGVPDALSPDERGKAVTIAQNDSRIRRALATDGRLTQVLAAGPDLVHRWEQAPDPYAKAIITAAADARRLGVHSPLSRELLTEAMADYLQPVHRSIPHDVWLERALPYAEKTLHGDIAVLSPSNDGIEGALAGYVAADFLVQHFSRHRREACPPDSLWRALARRAHSTDDLRRLAASAKARMRYRYAEVTLRRLVERDDGGACVELAGQLVRQNRIDEAVDVLHTRLSADPADDTAVRTLAITAEISMYADELRAREKDPLARELLAELLADGGTAHRLRIQADEDEGNRVAADHLAELLARRGCLRELAERADAGHEHAAGLLAEILAGQGRLDALRQRADAGDEAARQNLAKLLAAAGEMGELADRAAAGDRFAAAHLAECGAGDSVGTQDDTRAVQAQVAELQQAADNGDPEAAEQLTWLLFELRDEERLRREVDAGTYQAAERLVALLTAENMAFEEVNRIRAYGLAADGSTGGPETPI